MAKKLNTSEVEEIQFSFPNEPNWEEVSDQTLVRLLENYADEQSCATIAIGVLHRRKNKETERLASWLLSEPDADEWLKSCAHDILEASDD